MTWVPPTEQQMEGIRDALEAEARKVGAELGLDEIGMANGLSFAAVTILYRLCARAGKLDQFLWAIKMLNDTNMRAAADMASGQETKHQRVQ